MTTDRCFNRARLTRPPDQHRVAVAVTDRRGSEPGSNAQIPDSGIARRQGWRGDRRQPAARNAAIQHSQTTLPHAMPIAVAVGGAV
jgi:hypothetical protein